MLTKIIYDKKGKKLIFVLQKLEVAATKSNMQKMVDETNQLYKNTTELQEVLEQREITIKDLEEKLNTVNETSQDGSSNTNSKLAAMEKQLADTQRKLKASLVSRKSVMAKLKDAETRAGVAEKLNESLNEEKEALVVQLNESINTPGGKVVNESLQQSSLNESVLEEKENQVINLESQNAELQKQVKELKALTEVLNADKNALQQQKASLEEKISQLSSLEVEVAGLQSQVNESKTLSQKLTAEQIALKQEKQSLEETVRAKDEELSLKDQNIASLDTLLETLKRELQEQKIELSGKLQEVQSDVDYLSNLNKSLQSELEATQEDLKHKMDEVFQLTSDLASSIDRKEEIEIELQSMNEKHLREIEIHQSTVRDLENKVQEASASLKEISNNQQFEEELEMLRLQLKASCDNTKQIEDMLKDREKHCEELNSRLEGKTQELQIATDELRCLKDSHEEQEIQKSKDFETIEAEIRNLKQENNDMTTNVTFLQQQANEAENTAQILRNENSRLNSEISYHRNQILETESQIESSQLEVENSRKLLQSRLEEIDHLNQSVEDLQYSLKIAEETQQKAALEHQSLQKSEADEKMMQVQRKLKAALVSRKELLSTSKKLEEELSARKKQTADLQQDVEQLQGNLKEKEDHVERLEEEVAQMRSTSSDSGSALEELKLRNKELSDEKLSLDEQLKLSCEKMANLEAEVATLQTCNQDMNEMVAAMESRSAKMEKNLAERSEALRSAQKCIRKLEKTLGQGEASAQETTSFKNRIRDLEEGNELLISKCEALDAEKKEKVVMLEKLMSDFEKQCLERDELVHQCEQLQSKLKDLSGAVVADETQKLLEELRAEQGDLKKENEVLRAKCEELEKSLSSSTVLDPNSDLVATLQEENNLSAKEIKDLRNKIAHLEAGVTKARATEAAKDNNLPIVELRDETLQQTQPRNEDEEYLVKARRELIDETLKQLKATQPDMWEQEPGIKILLNKLEEVAHKAASHKKFAEEMLEKFSNEEARAKELGVEVKDLQDDVAKLKEVAIKRDAENKLLQEEKLEHEKVKLKCEALQRDCDHLNSAFQVEKESYEQVQKRLEKENALIREKLRERRRSESAAVQRLQSLEEEDRASQSRCSQLEEEVKTLEVKIGEMLSSSAELESVLRSEIADGAAKIQTLTEDGEILKAEVEKLTQELNTVTVSLIDNNCNFLLIGV